jgi:hypothetical protein
MRLWNVSPSGLSGPSGRERNSDGADSLSSLHLGLCKSWNRFMRRWPTIFAFNPIGSFLDKVGRAKLPS